MKLSIITVNLNNREGLLKTIQSVVNQTYINLEYIVIDGYSTDGSVEVIKQYSDKITYWVSEPDNGIYHAMNKGIRKACGKYCLFLNSGDWFYDKNVLTEAFNNDFNEDLVYGIQMIENEKGITETKSNDPEYITFSSFMKTSLPHQCTFIKRELFDKVGIYNENNRIVSDWEFNLLAIFKFNCSIRKISQPIAVYNTNGISNSQEFMDSHKSERKKTLMKHFPRIVTDYYDFERIQSKLYFKFYYWLRTIKNNALGVFKIFWI